MGGQGVCRQCGRGKGWDVFYVVASSEAVKFGITTGDPRPRLKDHRLHGYRDIIRLVTGLPDATALAAEDAVRSALTLAGESPLQGREYFPMHCLALILDVADSWLIVTDQEQLTA